jgi:hypothetical protein
MVKALERELTKTIREKREQLKAISMTFALGPSLAPPN